ncbi:MULTISPECIES: hypothetical protein [Desulfurococcus]
MGITSIETNTIVNNSNGIYLLNTSHPYNY